jgi:hypothetical protein
VETISSKHILHSNRRRISVSLFLDTFCSSSSSTRCRRYLFSSKSEFFLWCEERQLPILSFYGLHFLYTGLSSNKRWVGFRLERHLRVRGMVAVPYLARARSSERGSGGCTFRSLWRTRTVLHSSGCTTEGRVRATPKNALRTLQCRPCVVDNLDDASG